MQALIEIEKNPDNAMRDFATVMAYSTLGREKDAQLLLSNVTADAGELRPARVAAAHSWRGETDLALVVPGQDTARIQEIHLLAGHLLCERVERAFVPDGS